MSNKTGKVSGLSLDAVSDDLFGLSFKALRSVRVLWLQPRKYFEASKQADWGGIYTPSIRLWLSFFALFSALKFWWIGDNVGMIEAFATGFENAGLVLPEGVTYEEVGRETVLWVFSTVTVLQAIAMVLLSLVYSAWGEATTLAQRQRYLFAVIVPGASLMPISMTLMMLVPGAWLTAYGIGLAVVTYLVDFLSGYRGGFAEVSGFARVWRAALLAFILVIVNVLLSIGTQIAGILTVGQRFAVPVAG